MANAADMAAWRRTLAIMDQQASIYRAKGVPPVNPLRWCPHFRDKRPVRQMTDEDRAILRQLSRRKEG